MAQTDTIVAIATPIGRSGVGVVRMSGPESLKIVKKLARMRSLANRKAVNAWISLPGGKPLDNVIILYIEKAGSNPHAATSLYLPTYEGRKS